MAATKKQLPQSIHDEVLELFEEEQELYRSSIHAEIMYMNLIK